MGEKSILKIKVNRRKKYLKNIGEWRKKYLKNKCEWRKKSILKIKVNGREKYLKIRVNKEDKVPSQRTIFRVDHCKIVSISQWGNVSGFVTIHSKNVSI